ncbi:DEAD/DEAH box helicase [Paenibacillus algorifonticola]|uniref:DEAD/DEAH box helicase n=1 Tax=Paenibacillus algorifonticola TaxID=684063 RepID=UPI003D265249
MSSNPFYRLAPFIQEFIYKKKWDVLREAQADACHIILDTNKHLLIASGTASGKTEAAFFPTITMLDHNPSGTVGILYISPLKALINDQFHRLEELLQEASIPVWAWHGDASQSAKQRLLKKPSGILQITPESLEAMLMNRPELILPLFGDLRFIIIDEIHAFMGTDRGIQLQCQLVRLARLSKTEPRRIGLSATLRDYDYAANWLALGTAASVQIVAPQTGRKLRLAVDHFMFPSVEIEEDEESFLKAQEAYYKEIYNATYRHKALIFANSRQDTEHTIMEMRRLAQERQEADIFYVHHGNISTQLREEAEAALREVQGPVVAAATLTLELGIDLGELERVVQLGAPYSCSSFVQRLGRSGRKKDASSEMIFFCSEKEYEGALLPEQLPWEMLRAIAIIELYIREKWVESFKTRGMPLGLLYHQSMSLLKGMGEAKPAVLASAVLSLPAFKDIQPDAYRLFLRHLIKTDHLEITETGTLIIGLTGEKIVNHFRFYSVFEGNEEFFVFNGSQQIGSLDHAPPVENCFTLAGKIWEVTGVDDKRKHIYVVQAKGRKNTIWNGTQGHVDTHVMKKIREILTGSEAYVYLKPNAAKRLEQARHFAANNGLLEDLVVAAGGEQFYIIPWVGSQAFDTLIRVLRFELYSDIEPRSIKERSPYFLRITSKIDAAELKQKILSTIRKPLIHEALMAEDEAPRLGKYEEFIPPKLLRKAFLTDGIHLEELIHALQ